MRTFIVILCLLFCAICILLCQPPPGQGQILGAYGSQAIEQPDNVVFVGKGGEFPAMQSAITSLGDGGVLYVWPGTYSDSNLTVGTAIFIEGMGPLGSVIFNASDTIFILGGTSRGFHIENITISCAGTGSWMRAGTVNYSISNSRIKANAFNIGDNVTYFEGNQFEIGTYGGMYAGGTTGSSADSAWFVDCQWGYPLFVEPVWQYPLSAGATAQNGLKVVDGAFAHTRYSRIYSDSTCIAVAANSGFGGGYHGIFYNAGDGPTFTNLTTSGGGSFLWSAMENNDATNGTVQMAGSGSVSLVENFMMNKESATAPTYKSTSSAKSLIMGGHYVSSATGGASVMTIPAIDYTGGVRGWLDNGSSTALFGLNGTLKIVDDPGDVPFVRNVLGTILSGTDTTFWVDGDSVIYDVVRDRGAY
jgi:hypothetical protein